MGSETAVGERRYGLFGWLSPCGFAFARQGQIRKADLPNQDTGHGRFEIGSGIRVARVGAVRFDKTPVTDHIWDVAALETSALRPYQGPSDPPAIPSCGLMMKDPAETRGFFLSGTGCFDKITPLYGSSISPHLQTDALAFPLAQGCEAGCRSAPGGDLRSQWRGQDQDPRSGIAVFSGARPPPGGGAGHGPPPRVAWLEGHRHPALSASGPRG